jgi:hypothetical protein
MGGGVDQHIFQNALAGETRSWGDSSIESEPWVNRPSDVGLFHAMAQAKLMRDGERAIEVDWNGQYMRDLAIEDAHAVVPGDIGAEVDDYRVIGLGPWANESLTENAYRGEREMALQHLDRIHPPQLLDWEDPREPIAQRTRATLPRHKRK